MSEFRPSCAACGYVGKPQPTKARAAAAIRQHNTAPSHRRAVRQQAIAQKRSAA